MKSPAQISPPPRSSKNADYFHGGNRAPRATLRARHIARDERAVLSARSEANNEAHRTEPHFLRKLGSVVEHPDSEGRRPGSGKRRDFPFVFSANRHRVRGSVAGNRVHADKTQANQVRNQYPGSALPSHETVRKRRHRSDRGEVCSP